MCKECEKMSEDLKGTELEDWPHDAAECACECHEEEGDPEK